MSKFWIAVVIAACLDIMDFFGGWIPLLGDAIDLIGIATMFFLIGPTALIAVMELVPFLDFMPFFLTAVFLSRTDLLKGMLGGKTEV